MKNAIKAAGVLITLVALFSVISGCTSFRSTIADRNSDDTISPQFSPRTVNGVPVKLKVPSHYEVRIVETYFLMDGPVTACGFDFEEESVKIEFEVAPRTVKDANGNDVPISDLVSSSCDLRKTLSEIAKITPKANQKLSSKAKIVATKKPAKQFVQPGSQHGRKPILSVECNLEYTDKVFVVDFPRPIAGSLSLLSGSDKKDGLTFDAQQYFASIRGAYQEDTLSTINEIVSGKSEEAETKSTTTIDIADVTGVQRLTRVVAFERFDISECGWEQRMHDFVHQHLGQCNKTCYESEDCYQTEGQNSFTGSAIIESPVVAPSYAPGSHPFQ